MLARVLLCERKRQAARHVASACPAVRSWARGGGRGTPTCSGQGVGGTPPDLAGVPPVDRHL